MTVVLTIGTVRRAKLQSNRHHQQISSFYSLDALLLPNQQCQSIEGSLHSHSIKKHVSMTAQLSKTFTVVELNIKKQNIFRYSVHYE